MTLKVELHNSVGEQYAAGEEWRNRSRKNEEIEPKWKQRLAVDVSGGESKVQCYKVQYCIKTTDIVRELSYQFRDLNVQCSKQKKETGVCIYVFIPWK